MLYKENKMQINLMTPINQLGYGVAGLNIFKELRKQADVSLFPIGEPQVVNEEMHTLSDRACL